MVGIRAVGGAIYPPAFRKAIEPVALSAPKPEPRREKHLQTGPDDDRYAA
jgi:hypothetical protein